MDFLVLTYTSPKTGELLYQIDLTMHEFIPWARTATRFWEREYPQLRHEVEGYQVLVEPQYAGTAAEAKFKFVVTGSADRGVPQSQPLVMRSQIMQMLDDEFLVFNNPGYRQVCRTCREQKHCPSSGLAETHEIADWIRFKQETVVEAEAVIGFKLWFQNISNKTFLTWSFPLTDMLQLFSSVYSEAERQLRLPLPSGNLVHADIFARINGGPQVNSILEMIRKLPTMPTSALHATSASRNGALVDWDSVEDDAALDEILDITVIDEEDGNLTPIVKPFPQEHAAALIGELQPNDLPVFIHRAVLEGIRGLLRQPDITGNIGGLLAGDVYTSEKDGRFFVEITGFVPAQDAMGITTMQLNYKAWSDIEKRFHAAYDSQRIMGWFRTIRQDSQLLVVMDRYDYDLITKNSLNLTYELKLNELSSHPVYFPQPWQIAVVLSSELDVIWLYQWRNDQLSTLGGYYLID